MKNLVSRAVLSTALVALMAGGAAAADPVKGGVLRVGLAAEPEALDPATVRTVAGWETMMPMCQGLYNIGPDGFPAPQLADDLPIFTDGGLTVEVKLKKGEIFYNDGTPFTPESAKAGFERTIFGAGGVTPLGQYMEAVEATADSVIFKMKSVYAPFLADLAGPNAMLVSPTHAEAVGDQFGQQPVCVGPYKFVSRVAGSDITLEASEHYYDQGAINFDQIVFKVVTDENARVLGVRSGDLDIIENPPIPELDRLESDGLKVTKFTGLGWTGLLFNVGNGNGFQAEPAQREVPVAQHAAIRQAISKAIDRNAISQLLSRGQSLATCDLISPSYGLDTTAECGPRDVEGAKALIASTGVDLPIQISVLVSRDVRALEAIQAMVKEIGVDITIDSCDASTCLNRYQKGEADAYFNTWSGLPDVDTLQSALFSAASALNGTRSSNTAIDELLAQARSEVDKDARQALYAEWVKQMDAEAVAVSVGNPAVAVVSTSKLSGIGFAAPGKLDVSASYFTE